VDSGQFSKDLLETQKWSVDSLCAVLKIPWPHNAIHDVLCQWKILTTIVSKFFDPSEALEKTLLALNNYSVAQKSIKALSAKRRT
jgi:hypothetical protein